MREDIGTNSDAATIEIFNKLVGICLVVSLYIFHQFNLVHLSLLKFSCYRRNPFHNQCFMTMLITLLIITEILIDWISPVFVKNLLPYSPCTCFELFIQLFVVAIIVFFIELYLCSLLNFSDNRCYCYTMIFLGIILSICLMFYNTCATLNVIFIMLK